MPMTKHKMKNIKLNKQNNKNKMFIYTKFLHIIALLSNKKKLDYICIIIL